MANVNFKYDEDHLTELRKFVDAVEEGKTSFPGSRFNFGLLHQALSDFIALKEVQILNGKRTGRKKIYENAAARQAAYYERKKAEKAENA